ncbi:M20 aminoacylase family protein [Afifella marina]|uniref:Hippurate hydrolase n=1 Tax=Afifella marina DSM 2698 TaxID=1120955 RepID=A0A1G5P000_AFIMA|nr:M20 aminoacylase family protein [Afifella marina]MBK1624974.1 amidohydrolase [Afifella marina DSM 2698]MBK1628678.1 amidohydrolase [Afifella marina]MBK5916508.1 amidohydrolase [Afifella marina]RAI17615.1 amidohydrolase [Afifella marina DSM 2698]SCZ42499.1 hippurate hydrolase [Afifella marina DSM 2698]
MPVINSLAEAADEITQWRRDFHRNPELLYDVPRTAKVVADKLRAFGCDEVVEGIGRSGVVGIIRGRGEGDRGIGLRADMDALPIEEESGKPWRSETPGKMHACGHDGHMAMLLGAARYLAETRNFAGRAVIVFQPAEEGGAGARAMIEDGLMERFAISEIYGLHNMPGIPVGQFGIRPGPLMAATDNFVIQIEGKGSHAAKPHAGVDPVLVGSQIVNALQSVASRNVDPLKSAVVSVTTFHAGDTFNVIPQRGTLKGTVRTLDPGIRDLVERRMNELVPTIGQAFGARARLDYQRHYPVTVNHEEQTHKAAAVAREIAGEGAVTENTPPLMAGEDFSYMLEARPGAFIFLGNGDSAGLHHPAYDFNDGAAPYGASYLARLVETGMPA